ncbi:MAG: pimeloyl-ACP methyl ester carboxylesterase [Gammaproteobacteria bacterium]|jgi:pimeloyl-ACP methyl ester carboxylesterase
MNTKADPISLIYQATLEPELWLELLEQMEHLFNEAVHPEQEFNLLAEHCQRARKITQELHGLQEQSGTWKHLIDHLPMSVFFVNPELQVVAQNERAATLLQDEQFLYINQKQQLELKSTLLSKQLHTIMSQALNFPTQGMQIDTDAKVLLMAVPIRKIEIDTSLKGATTAVLIFTADEKITPDLSVIRSLHQLTYAEARLTHGLCLTSSLSDAAKLSGVSLNTARSYLKSIYSKTSSNSQLTLVRKVIATSFATLGFACSTQLDKPLEQLFTLSDNRLLTWFEYGDPQGLPIIIFESIGGALPNHQDSTQYYLEKKLRIIVIIRPGYGSSTSKEKISYKNFSHDVVELLDHLRLKKVSVIGYSLGGAYGSVFAACYPERVNHLGLFSSSLPRDYMSQPLAPHLRMMLRVFTIAPDIFKYVMSLIMHSTLRDPQKYYTKIAKQLNDTDSQILNGTLWQERIGEQLRHRLMGGVKVYVQEYMMMTRGWEVELSDIQCPTLIWHGDEDNLVNIHDIKALANDIEYADLVIFKKQGHYLICDKWHDFLNAYSKHKQQKLEFV